MIVYISTEINSRLLEGTEVFVKTYIRWKYNAGNFIKEEYANILSFHPDAIVVDDMAFDDTNACAMLEAAFPGVKFILTVGTEEAPERKVPPKWDTVKRSGSIKENVMKLVYPEPAPEEEKILIGIMADDNALKINAAFNLTEWFLQYTDSICLVEVSQKSVIPEYENKLGLKKNGNYYEYGRVPVLFNMAESDVYISVFFFGRENRKMFEKCGYRLEIEDGTLKTKDESYKYQAFKDPIHDDRSGIYREIFSGVPCIAAKTADEPPPEEKKEPDGQKKNKTGKEKIRKRIRYGILIFSFSLLAGMLLTFFLYRGKNINTSGNDGTKTAVSKEETTVEETVAETPETVPRTTKEEETAAVTEKKTTSEKATSEKEKAAETTAVRETAAADTSAARSGKTETVTEEKTPAAKKKKVKEKQTTAGEKKTTTGQVFETEYIVD